MDLALQDKKAFVLAASKGLGKAVALSLANEGCEVVIASSNKVNLDRAKSEIKKEAKKPVSAYVMDVRSIPSVEEVSRQILKDHGHIDILVTNSPGPPPKAAAEIDSRLLHDALNTNLVSVVALCNIFLPSMRQKRFGRIINLASFTGREPAENMVLSNVTRAGTIAYCKTLSREIAKDGVTVNSILTGGVLTDRTLDLVRLAAKKAGITESEALERSNEKHPVGFIATPEQFSHAVTFLASPLSMNVNGVSLPIDGGLMRSH